MSDAPYAGLGVRTPARPWRRWQMEAFDQPQQALTPEESAAATAKRVAELSARHEAACKAGYEEGKEIGRKEGHAEGLEAGRAEGQAAGQATGYEAGLADGRAAAQAEAQRLNTLVQATADSLSRVEAEMGQALLTLALDIARQVVRTTLAEQPDTVLAAVREVLHADHGDAAPLRLWVHPADQAMIRQHLGDELAAGKWSLWTDETLTPGGCRAETAYGTIDATLETRWRRVAASLGKSQEWSPEP
ncbi:Flagellar assembly protein FliH [plant metagenome]|uniref:Flagellar assembly protein FliH n=2 Tax=plant metagenome TaxID=1297885 RepID=A0A484USP8_9ZZZZ